MFFFFPFEGMEAPSAGRGSRRHATLPLLPAPKAAFGNSGRGSRGFDFLDLSMDFLHRTIAGFSSSLTALSNSANALFAQVASALAFDRMTRDGAAFINAAFSGFGAPLARQSPFGFASAPQMQGMPFSPMSFLAPWAINPWAAFGGGLDFWTKMWMPAEPQRSSWSPPPPPAPAAFKTKVSTPGGFSWAFSLNE
jgi:hypothetical protein